MSFGDLFVAHLLLCAIIVLSKGSKSFQTAPIVMILLHCLIGGGMTALTVMGLMSWDRMYNVWAVAGLDAVVMIAIMFVSVGRPENVRLEIRGPELPSTDKGLHLVLFRGDDRKEFRTLVDFTNLPNAEVSVTVNGFQYKSFPNRPGELFVSTPSGLFNDVRLLINRTAVQKDDVNDATVSWSVAMFDSYEQASNWHPKDVKWVSIADGTRFAVIPTSTTCSEGDIEPEGAV